MTRAAIVTGRVSENQIGRTHSVYMVAQAAQLSVELVTFSDSREPMWEPLRDSHFDRACRRVTTAEFTAVAEAVDVVIATKPRRNTLGVAFEVCRNLGKPLIVDIDDPEFEVHRAFLRNPRSILRPRDYLRRTRDLIQMRRLVDQCLIMTSNPVLHRTYGGHVLPHAREDPGVGKQHVSAQPRVGFIGTPWAHKGIDILRHAVADLAPMGMQLVVTADAPAGTSPPWEQWVGRLSAEESMKLLQEIDIVALPSRDSPWGRGQLPMKLIDAMLAGRAIAVSRLEPLTWAAGSTGLSVSPGSKASLVQALVNLTDPRVRQELGDAARARALSLFTPEALAPDFREFIERASAPHR